MLFGPLVRRGPRAFPEEENEAARCTRQVLPVE